MFYTITVKRSYPWYATAPIQVNLYISDEYEYPNISYHRIRLDGGEDEYSQDILIKFYNSSYVNRTFEKYWYFSIEGSCGFICTTNNVDYQVKYKEWKDYPPFDWALTIGIVISGIIVGTIVGIIMSIVGGIWAWIKGGCREEQCNNCSCFCEGSGGGGGGGGSLCEGGGSLQDFYAEHVFYFPLSTISQCSQYVSTNGGPWKLVGRFEGELCSFNCGEAWFKPKKNLTSGKICDPDKEKFRVCNVYVKRFMGRKDLTADECVREVNRRKLISILLSIFFPCGWLCVSKSRWTMNNLFNMILKGNDESKDINRV